MLLATFPCFEDLIPFAININDRKRPEWTQIDSRHEFGSERWQKRSMPSKQAYQGGCNRKIEQVVSSRQRAFGKEREHENLECVSRHGQNHGGLKTRSN